MYALLSTEWNVDEVTDMVLFKSHQEVQADPERHMSFDDTPRDPAVRTTESFDQDTENPDAPFKVKKGAPLMAAVCCFNRTEIKADVAQYPRKWKMGFPCGSYDSQKTWHERRCLQSWGTRDPSGNDRGRLRCDHEGNVSR